MSTEMTPEATPEAKIATATREATDFTLTPPDPVPAVEVEKAAGLVPVSEEDKSKLDTKVDQFVNELVAVDSNSPEFGQKVDQITRMGQEQIRAAAAMSNRFLDRPVRAMDDESSVGKDLAELRRTVEDLDPGRKERLLEPRKLFGIIPFGNRLKNYFDSYSSSQDHIQSILKSLESGKIELHKDNAEIDVERQKLWAAMGELEQMIHIAKTLDARLEAKAIELDASDPEKAKALRESALFYVRQRTQDLLTQMAVTVQGYLALDLVKKNNVELVKGVDRAGTTTVSALRTAVTVAQAMTNQRLVLDQITSLNETTSNIIDSTSTLLRENTATIHEQAARLDDPAGDAATRFPEHLRYDDEVDEFKLRALVR